MILNISSDFFKKNMLNWHIITELYKKGFINFQTLQDYATQFLQEKHEKELEQAVVNLLLEKGESPDTYCILDCICVNSGDIIDYGKVQTEALSIVLKWVKENRVLLDDPIDFRELIFEILKTFDFPEREVDRFLSSFLDREEIKRTLNNAAKL